MADPMLAPCGIDCSTCSIHRAKSEPETMKSILDWFRNERKKELSPDQIQCDGCLGDRTKHWSGDCGILKCAVDEHHHQSCSACDDFPCGRLDKWAQGGAKYTKALGSLKEMKKAKQP